jgi:hypothetical protein
MSDIIDVEILDGADVLLELSSGVIYVGGGGGGGSEFISYAANQSLTLAQLRTARRNLNVGSAPTLTYDINGRVSSIAYADGSSKTFAYNGNGELASVVFTYGSRVYTKTMSYAGGILSSISESVTGV